MIAHFVTYRPNRDRSKPNVLDRYDDFLSWKEMGRIEGWSARKTFQPGDLAIFYMASPMMSIVGLGLVGSEPYYEEIDDPADYKNPVDCDFRPVWFLDNLVLIKDAIENQGLEKWWRTCPYQSIRRIKPLIAQALISEVLSVNPSLKEEFLRLGWGSSRFPDLRQPVPSKPQNNWWEVADCLNLTWRQFELLVSEVFKRKHKRTRVELTPRAKDYGVDIVITTGMLPQKEIVQCKRYRPGVNVSCPDMQKFVGAMTKFKADKGYFVTTSTFSRYAIDFAEGLNVELIDGQGLIQVIGQIKDFPSPAEFASRYR